MFKIRSRSKNKAALGCSAEEEAALDDDEDKGLQFIVKESSETVNEDSKLVFKKTHRRQSSRSLPKMDILSLQSELANGNCPETADRNVPEPETNGKEWFRTWPENKRAVSCFKEPQPGDEDDNHVQRVANNNYERRARQTIPLDQLLQAMPLAYSPITKQLHVVSKPCEPPPDDPVEEESQLNCKSSSPMSSLSNFSEVTMDSMARGLSSPSLDDDSTSTASLRDAFLAQQGPSQAEANKAKQSGAFSSVFSKSLFGWKGSSKDTSLWKIFGRKTPAETLFGEEAASSHDFSPSASSGSLILEARPSHLPAKSPEEEERHRLEYEQMVQAAKKKELKEAKQRRKQMQQQLKVEDHIASAAKTWTSEVLPKWETNKTSKRVRDLWWQGIPPCVRGRVWRLAVGNELNITPDLYQICVSRAQERLQAVKSCNSLNQMPAMEPVHSDKESSVQLIQLDIARTFPLLCIFQKGGPYYNVLHSLLGAYVCYRPDVGYVQGMSFIAAVLILNLEPADAFVCLANMLNRPCLRAFYRMDEARINAYYATYNDLLQDNLPALSKYFELQSLTPDLYLLDWMYTMFSRAMPLDVTCRVWDVYLRDGEEFLFRTALGVLHMYQETLKEMDFLHGSQFLTKLPDDICGDSLFRSIDAIHMYVGKLKFECVLAKHNEGSGTPP